KLERYVEDFLVLANQLSWHDAALGACFQMGPEAAASSRKPLPAVSSQTPPVVMMAHV
ncbi:hypothetical protein M9458_056266, partial [Cirrhinus mrigala]